MAIQKQSYQITGMRQDNLIGTGYSTKFAHEIMNMRLNTIGDYTTASWTTEKGTKSIKIKPMSFKDDNNTPVEYLWLTDDDVQNFQPIGQANINDDWILFGVIGNDDYILNLHFATDNTGEHLFGRVLYKGDLNFDVEHPIETITFYENEKLQKVYWTDGFNQPRVINIKGAEGIINGFDSTITTQFDFTQEVSLNEIVEITKDQSGSGLFPPCTVKYAISYYHKYGQESNIVYDSPLYYPVIGSKACSPDELSGDSFYIKVSNLDLTHGFDYIRLYSIVKTSDDATPIVRIVEDKPISEGVTSVTFHDTNTTGEIIDPSIIQFIGGKEIIAHTFDQKNNTLFLGNIELKTKSVTEILKDKLTDLRSSEGIFELGKEIGVRRKRTSLDGSEDNSTYQYINELNETEVYHIDPPLIKKCNGDSNKIKIFKYKEWYRFGIQFQDNKGSWSEVIFLKDIKNEETPYTLESNPVALFSRFKYTLPYSIEAELISNDYKKARIVCCYPTNADREIIAQGVIAPTVYNVRERKNHAPDVMSSWFFRPHDGSADTNNNVLPWAHNSRLRPSWMENCEIQCISTEQSEDGASEGSYAPTSDNHHYNSNGDGAYVVNHKVLTFHSPDIEFDESIRTLDLTNANIVLIGSVPIQSYASKYYLNATAPMSTVGGHKGEGFIDNFVSVTLEQSSTANRPGTHSLNAAYWDDRDVYHWDHAREWGHVRYPLYPFQRKSSVNNYMKDMEYCVSEYGDNHDNDEIDIDINQTAKINTKVFSNICYSAISKYALTEYPITANGFSFFDSNEVTPLQIRTNNSHNDILIYQGNVNTIAPLSTGDHQELRIHKDSAKNKTDTTFYGHYKLYNYVYKNNEWILEWYPGRRVDGDVKESGSGGVSDDPVPITFKSTPHGVFYSDSFVAERQGMTIPIVQLIPTGFERTNLPFLYLAELRRNISNDTRFGGYPINNPSLQNTYIPCGPAVKLNASSDITLYGLEGDTYYMRYDNLKTYPFSTEDVNQIVEILSFMCETRINLDGRYDKNRGLLDNTMVTNTNFNLLNKSYTQNNNTFTFLTLDKLSAELNFFNNQITWTNEKVSGEDVDAWTNITMASTADADGTLGSISKILNFNDNLMLFQDHGLARIGFNERTAISTENGVPLELAKTGKYTGLDYISREVGCQNKWSISNSKNGIFWIDDSRQELVTYSEGIKSLSTANGFDAFMIKQLPSIFKPWNPRSFSNFVTYYDKLSNDVYYINNDTCLAWNEQTGTFTSFYSYEKTPYMMNVGTHSLMWNCGVWAARELSEYSKFFDNVKDYWMTLVCDGMTSDGNAFSADKVFNNIEYRADVYDIDHPHGQYEKPVFNKKSAWNGYQLELETATNSERKFNTWRVQLPRASYDGIRFSRDRMRNPFCYIKLKQDQLMLEQTNRMILHDLAVYFDMK